MSNTTVPEIYKWVIDEVVEKMARDFSEMGVSETILQELQQTWENKLYAMNVAPFARPAGEYYDAQGNAIADVHEEGLGLPGLGAAGAAAGASSAAAHAASAGPGSTRHGGPPAGGYPPPHLAHHAPPALAHEPPLPRYEIPGTSMHPESAGAGGYRGPGGMNLTSAAAPPPLLQPPAHDKPLTHHHHAPPLPHPSHPPGYAGPAAASLSALASAAHGGYHDPHHAAPPPPAGAHHLHHPAPPQHLHRHHPAPAPPPSHAQQPPQPPPPQQGQQPPAAPSQPGDPHRMPKYEIPQFDGADGAAASGAARRGRTPRWLTLDGRALPRGGPSRAELDAALLHAAARWTADEPADADAGVASSMPAAAAPSAAHGLHFEGLRRLTPAEAAALKRRGVPQVDGAVTVGGDDDDDDDDDDGAAAGGGGGGAEDINSDLDDSSSDDEDLETDHVVLCQWDRVQRHKNKYKCAFRDGIVSVNGKDYLFTRATAEFEW